ncbi:MAG: GAF domain-containing protein, partial [Ginsengibacter sp.]
MNRLFAAFIKTSTHSTSVLFLLLLFSITSASGQPGTEKGLPFITNYTAKMYHGNVQNWSIEQDKNGMMYFANTGSDGRSIAMSYDGVKWNPILAPGIGTNPNTRCLVKDKDGIIYYGSVGDFGFLEHDSLGQTKAYSLIKYVPKDKRVFYDTWSAQITDKGIYFQSRERLFRLTKTGTGSNQQWSSKTWEPTTHFMYTFFLDGILYVHEQGIGLLKMVNDSLTLIPGSEFLGKDRLQVMLPYNRNQAQKIISTQNEYLLGSMGGNLYVFDGKNFSLFKTEADSILRSALLYKGTLLDGNFALATTGKGLIIINPAGKIQQVINRSSGLQSESIYSIFLDNTGALWLGLDNGISKVDVNSPFTKFGLESGITSSVLSMARLPDGSFYLGTNNGLLQYNPSHLKFEINKVIAKNQVFSLLVDGKTLLIATDGLYMIKDNRTLLVQPSIAGNLKLTSLSISKRYPNILYAGTSFGITLFVRDPEKNTGWEYVGEVPNIKEGVWSFAEKKDGEMWAGTQTGATFLVTLSIEENGQPDLSETHVEVFGPKQGFKTPFSSVFTLNHTIYFGADSATYTFNESKNQFVKATFDGLTNFGGVEDSTGKMWMGAGDADHFVAVIATPKPGGKYQLDSTSLLPVIGVAGIPYPDINDIVWFTASDGIIRYDQRIKGNIDHPYKTVISDITAKKQSLNPDEITGSKPFEIKFNQNSLRFEYAAPFYEQEDKVQYQTWLEGFEKTWSDLGKNTYKEYTNLSPGKYTFHVRAKNLYHQISEEAVYSFTILSPWYRTWWAYSLYALLFLLAGFLILRSRTAKLKTQHRELEKAIKERTAELSDRVKELAVINSVQDGLVREMKVQSIYELVGNRICELFDTQTVLIRTFNYATGNEEWQYVIEKGVRLYSDPRPFIWANKQLIENKQPILINKDYLGFAAKHGSTGVTKGLPPKSALFVPMIVGDQVRGSVSLQNVEKENAFSDTDARLLATLTNSMSVALENARLFDETNYLLADAKQRASELTTVNNISKALASQLNPGELIQFVGDQLRDLFNANIVYLALLDKKTKMINFPYKFGDEMKPIKLGDGFSSKIILSGTPILLNKDVSSKTLELGIHRSGLPAASYLGVPIPVGDEIIGVLSVQSTEQENRFNENDQRLLSTIASSVGVALRNAQLFEDVQQAKMEAENASNVAKKANEAKSAFLSTVSHELRTPLTSVLGFAKIISKRLHDKIFPIVDQSDPKIEKTVNQINENLQVVISEGERLTHLINDVLDLAKIEAGKMEWNEENVSIPEVVERAIAATTALFEQRGVTLIKKINNDVPEITGDTDKLIQVVINLFSNAVKFTEKGSVTCEVFQKDKEVIVSITDTGIGIAPEDY